MLKRQLLFAVATASVVGSSAAWPQAPAEKPPAIPPAAWPVSGIYTAPDTKDLGVWSGIPALSGTKIRGWVDGYYVYNFNTPDRATVNANRAASVIKGRDITVEGRTFDVRHNRPSFSLAEIEIEKVPEVGSVGFKLDVAFGKTQDIIVDTIRGALIPTGADESVARLKALQHASVSYNAPIGKGLRLDAGKFVTHIGGETIETVKNWNYSHSFFYTYAIPFQDTGLRLNYAWTDTFYTELYVLKGWNVTKDNNNGQTFGPSIGWTINPTTTLYANYLVGPEQTNNTSNQRHLVDAQLVLGPFADRWNFMINFDHGFEEKALGPTRDARWWGLAGYARYKVNDWLEPSLRLEYYDDGDGFTTGVAQKLKGITLTLNTKVGIGKGKEGMLLLRPEIRYDRSSANFFTKDSTFRSGKSQWTVGVGATLFF